MHKQIEMKGKEMKKKKKPIDSLLFCFTLQFVITWFAINILLNEMKWWVVLANQSESILTKTKKPKRLDCRCYHRKSIIKISEKEITLPKKKNSRHEENKKRNKQILCDSAIKREWQKRAHAIFQYRSMEQTVIALCKNKSNKTRCENSYLFLSISFFSFNNLLDINSGRAMYGKRSIARSSDSRLVLFFALS